MRRYVTTAIDYPNAAPHMGHVLEKVLADVVVRWFRVCGDDVRFQVGMDEHGIKMQRTAKNEGVTPQELLKRNVPLFRDLYERLNITYDIFVQTSDKKEHWPTVVELWKLLQKKGMLEKRKYTGFYCSGCERFMVKRDLVDGKCPDHRVVPEEISEENWFFLLSKEANWLKDLLTREDGYVIIPEFRAQETLALIKQGLEDVSFSRSQSSLSWGIPVPDDKEQTIYVWCDALTNYISGLDYFGLSDDSRHAKLGEVWWDEAEVTHVIGKDIARFHALYWPAMLKHAGVRTPDRLLIHGFLTSEGQKMSKSLGNVVKPSDVIDMYGVDPLRFYLSHEVPVGRDGDFSWERFAKLYDAKLRNDVGNLLQRVLVLLQKEGGELHRDWGEDMAPWVEYVEHMDAFALSQAISVPLRLATDANKKINATEPWKQEGEEKRKSLTHLAEALRHISLLLLPFIPEAAQRISQQLGVGYADDMLKRDFVIDEEMRRWGGQKDWKSVNKPEILFPPVEAKKDA